MEQFTAYHVVTDRPMQAGQTILFDETHHNGVYRRVMEKMEIVKDIMAHPETYNAQTLEHHTAVALRELALEEVRRAHYPAYPSRMGCLYVSETLEEAEKWGELFVAWGRPTYHIVKLDIEGNKFIGDANNCFAASIRKEENLEMARRYWENRPNAQGKPPIQEILVNGNIRVAEVVTEILQNLSGRTSAAE